MAMLGQHSFELPVVQAHAWYDTRHHNPDGGGFHNIWQPPNEYATMKAAGWLLGRAFTGRSFEPIAHRQLDPAELERKMAEPVNHFRVYWMGHSSALMRIGDSLVLTDPMFSPRASPVGFAGPERITPLPLRLDQIPMPDVVIISHNHYDHLDQASITELSRLRQPLYLVPLGLKALVESWGAAHVLELDWWQYVEVDGVIYTCTPAQHFSSRSPFDRNETLWASWAIEDRTSGTRVYFGGDTGYASFFSDIAHRLGSPDLAMIPVGAYQPRWFMREVHVTPEEGLQAYQDLGATEFLGIHWGTFDLADEPLTEPLERVSRSVAERGLNPNRIHLLEVGGSLER